MEKLTLKDIEKIKNTPYGNIIQDGTIRQMIFELDQYKQIEEELGCSLEVIAAVFKAIQQGFIFVDLGNELYREDNINLDYADISEDEEGYIGCYSKPTNYHYILDFDGCVFVEDYKKTWWLKKDKSE